MRWEKQVDYEIQVSSNNTTNFLRPAVARLGEMGLIQRSQLMFMSHYGKSNQQYFNQHLDISDSTKTGEPMHIIAARRGFVQETLQKSTFVRPWLIIIRPSRSQFLVKLMIFNDFMPSIIEEFNWSICSPHNSSFGVALQSLALWLCWCNLIINTVVDDGYNRYSPRTDHFFFFF